MYKVRYLSGDYQKNIFDESKKILEKRHKVGLEVFTSGGKSPISAELITYLREEKKCKNVLAVTNDATWAALSSRYELIGMGIDNIYHVKNSKLSRGNSLIDCIKEHKINPDDIDIIVFDECHKLFGENIRKELDENEDYIYSKYVIAMTATTYNGIAMIDSLKEIVGKSNIVKYDLNDAVTNDIIDPITMVNVSLQCEPEYYEYLDGILEEKGKKITNKVLLKLVAEAKNTIKKANISNLEELMYANITQEAKRNKIKLDATDGARVIVFFNRISEVLKSKNTLINVISRVYPGMTINFVDYTSKSSDESTTEAIRVLTSDKCDANTVDIIATCDMGAESFHPLNIQLGLVFGGTQSIRKEIQRIGRFIVQKQYKTCDCLIFDFSDISKLSRRALNNKNNNITYRISDINKLSRYFNDKPSVIEEMLAEYEGSINIISSTIDNNIIEKIERVDALVNILEGNEDILNYIDSHLKEIDSSAYLGNISKFFRDKVETDSEVLDNNMRDRYELIRNYIIYPFLDKKDMELLSSSFGKYGVRCYLNATMSSDKISIVKKLYREISTGKFDAADYWKPFMKREIPFEAIAIIYQNKEELLKIYNKFLSIDTAALSISKESKLYKFIEVYKQIISNIDKFSGGALKEVRQTLGIIHRYLSIRYSATPDEQKQIKNILASVLMVTHDLDIKIPVLKRADANAIKYLATLDIARSKPNFTINTKRIEKFAYELYTKNKLSKIEKSMIDLCILGETDEYGNTKVCDDFVEEVLCTTRGYRLASSAFYTQKSKDLLALLKYVDNGGNIPNNITKQFNVKSNLSKARVLYDIKSDISVIDAVCKKNEVSALQIIEMLLDDDEIMHDINNLVAINNKDIEHRDMGVYCQLKQRTSSKLSNETVKVLSSILTFDVINNNAALVNTIKDIV